jgi:hypothetical protein
MIMQVRFLTAAALAILNVATLPAFAAAPDANYLQNGLDGRGRCLTATDGKVAMAACNKSPNQQWVVGQGDIPGFRKLHTLADGAAMCLSVHPDDRKNVLAMEHCGKADNQQWNVERMKTGPFISPLTNRETGATRCLEALQTGMKMTPCSRQQPGHRWQSNYEPTM